MTPTDLGHKIRVGGSRHAVKDRTSAQIHVKNLLGYIYGLERGRDPSNHKGSRPISSPSLPATSG